LPKTQPQHSRRIFRSDSFIIVTTVVPSCSSGFEDATASAEQRRYITLAFGQMQTGLHQTDFLCLLAVACSSLNRRRKKIFI
jgi:hypothetical protein